MRRCCPEYALEFFEGRVYRLDRLDEWQVFLHMIGTSVVLYMYQLRQDSVMLGGSRTNQEEWEFRPMKAFSAKEKSR